ncbi:MAG TPA: hypothetical protein VFE03_07590 [Caulobacteraceae bacterium]|jgi:hypothetical protein|nr:hypothetical protein [Caulobacteraceae bacterium]
MVDRDAAPAYSIVWALIAALIGTAGFCGLVIAGGFGAGGGADPRLAWILTPVFCAPLVIYLAIRGRLRAGGIIVLLLGLTAIHFAAIATASATYKHPTDKSLFQMLDTHAERLAHEKEWRQRYDLGRRTALRAGLEAGAIGGLASLVLLLPFGRAFRRPRSLIVAGAGAATLTALGGFGLSGRLPGDMSPAEFALRLFAPWQAVLGLTLAVLFAAHRPGSSKDSPAAKATI